ncbi:MAG TPA: carbon storage regulator [Pirellulales bacterium]
MAPELLISGGEMVWNGFSDSARQSTREEPVLILRRRVGEKIVIGDGITVVINRVSGGRVTLGIEAPQDVHIVRGELRPFDESKPRPTVLPLAAPVPGALHAAIGGDLLHPAISDAPSLPR